MITEDAAPKKQEHSPEDVGVQGDDLNLSGLRKAAGDGALKGLPDILGEHVDVLDGRSVIRHGSRTWYRIRLC